MPNGNTSQGTHGHMVYSYFLCAYGDMHNITKINLVSFRYVIPNQRCCTLPDIKYTGNRKQEVAKLLAL